MKKTNTPSEAKARAKRLRDILDDHGHQLKHTESLEVISKLAGAADWNSYSAHLTKTQETLKQNPGDKDTEASSSVSDQPEKRVKDRIPYCSFCGKSQHEVRKLIAGPSVMICDECVDLCNDIITEEMKEQENENKNTDDDNLR